MAVWENLQVFLSFSEVGSADQSSYAFEWNSEFDAFYFFLAFIISRKKAKNFNQLINN